MAIEKNNETVVTEEDKVEETVEQPEGLPVDVTVEGEETVEERPQDDFNANLAEHVSTTSINILWWRGNQGSAYVILTDFFNIF